MIDVRMLRTDPEAVEAALARRGEDISALRRARELDERQRSAESERNDLRARIKSLSGEIGELHRSGRGDEAADLQAQSRALGEQEKSLDATVEELSTELRSILLLIPNLPAAEVPDGAEAADNVEIERHGQDPSAFAAHQRVSHTDIGAELGILDIERAVKISGAMFAMFRGPGATLARGLCQLALDRNADLYEEIRPPTIVRTETMIATGHLPKFGDEAYHMERDDLWAIPTAEVPLTSLGRDEVLDESDLPVRLMAQTSSFRREAGAAGRDTRGLLRVHEFDKVEILAYTTPAQAPELHRELLDRATSLLADLGLTYRILDLCAGDLGAQSARTFDLEAYAPGEDRWLECSSVSWFSDYQARRANIRYRPDGESGTRLVHTLNGSALAVPRVWTALVETHRQPDGSVLLPELLHPYMRGLERITP